MGFLATAKALAKTASRPVVEFAKTVGKESRPAPRRRDPFYSNDEHVREVNARANPQGDGWLTPRPGWLRR